MNAIRNYLGAGLALATLLVAGCGGSSGGSNDGGNNTPPPDGGGSAGITRSGSAIAVGPITGFGSVIVNGIEYATDGSTEYTKDGEPATETEFEVGEMVVIQGTIDDDNTNAVATSVDYDDNVEGPVSSVDTLNKVIVVLGQTVQLTATTSVDDSCPALLEDLIGVPAVEVSGPVQSDGTIVATRIECKAIAGEFEVTGTVSALDPGAMTFMVNALVVDYSAAMLENFPGGAITEGDPVEAKGNALGAADELLATRVEYKGNRFAENEGDHIEIEGFITRFVSDTDFDVAGLPVTTIPGTTVYEGGDAANLNLNLKVEVEGEFDANGVLVATKVEIKDATAVRVVGYVDSVTGDTLQILDITITTDLLLTRFEDKLNDLDPFRIGDLNPGEYVEIRGQESPPGQIFAFLLERDDPRAETELRGFVEAGGVARPNLTVLGVTIETNGATVYRDANENPFPNADAFWAAVGEGSLIDVKGTERGPTTLAAEEIEIELE
jgi:hypothetical protein